MFTHGVLMTGFLMAMPAAAMGNLATLAEKVAKLREVEIVTYSK